MLCLQRLVLVGDSLKSAISQTNYAIYPQQKRKTDKFRKSPVFFYQKSCNQTIIYGMIECNIKQMKGGFFHG